MITEKEPLIARVDDDGVSRQAFLSENFQHSTDVVVD
jgi:hypothetical protein